MFIIQLAILIYSVILHEIAHGWVADKLGDPTARLSKRLTLDPRPHIDLWMTILLPLFLLMSGAGVIFGAAKPVPIDPFNFRQPKKDTALTALAGPAANIAIAVLFATFLRVSYIFIVNDAAYSVLAEILHRGVILNISLAIFNLFPLPPLDGFKVLSGVVSDNLAAEMQRMERYGFLIIFFVLIFFPSLVFGFVAPLVNQLAAILLP